MTIKQVVKILVETKPRHPEDLDGKVLLRHLGNGSFREVYSVVNLRLVIKFPYPGDSNKEHARDEMIAIDKLKGGPDNIRKHAPKVYYSDWKTGVIAMKRYGQNRTHGAKLTKKLKNFFQTSPYHEDYGYGNFAKEGKTLIAVDLGIT